jgi:hypothetical protein
MANCTHRSEATFGEPVDVFSAEAGTLAASARMTGIVSEKIRIKTFISWWASSPRFAYTLPAIIVHRTIK